MVWSRVGLDVELSLFFDRHVSVADASELLGGLGETLYGIACWALCGVYSKVGRSDL